jgi:hypothetical protein
MIVEAGVSRTFSTSPSSGTVTPTMLDRTYLTSFTELDPTSIYNANGSLSSTRFLTIPSGRSLNFDHVAGATFSMNDIISYFGTQAGSNSIRLNLAQNGSGSLESKVSGAITNQVLVDPSSLKLMLNGSYGTSGQLLTSGGAGSMTWSTPASGSKWTQSGVNLYPTVSSNVGIGTSTPSFKLDVNGGGRFTSNVTANSLTMTAPGGGLIDNQNGLLFIQTQAGAGYIFREGAPNYTERMRLDGNGNLGIGIAPTARLDVNGELRIRTQAGTGTRMVVVDANGVQSTQAIPTTGNWSYPNGSVSINNGLVQMNSTTQIQPTSTPTYLLGNSANNTVGAVTLGSGLSIVSGELRVAAPTSHTYTSSGSFTVPAGAKAIQIIAQGGGGAGGYGGLTTSTGNTASGGQGGGAGGTSLYYGRPCLAYNFTVGLGGTATSGDGNSGGTTTVASDCANVIATGGQGGGAGNENAGSNDLGAGGFGSLADGGKGGLGIAGTQAGTNAIAAKGNSGGNSGVGRLGSTNSTGTYNASNTPILGNHGAMFGTNGRGASNNTTATSGTSGGGGGGGAALYNQVGGGSNRTGGNGGNGYVTFVVFY